MNLSPNDLIVLRASARKIINDVSASNMHRDVARDINVEAATILQLLQTRQRRQAVPHGVNIHPHDPTGDDDPTAQ